MASAPARSPACDLAAHQVARRLLVERVERQPAARPADRRGGVGAAAASRASADGEPLGVLVAGLEHPVVVEVGEQRAAVQRDRGLEPPGGTCASNSARSVSQRRPMRSRPATSASSAPSARRSAQAALRSEARALESRTSGQKRAATAPRGCSPGCSASQPSRLQARRLAGATTATAVDLGLQLPEEPHMQHRPTLHPL